jgi:hypothetical protein
VVRHVAEVGGSRGQNLLFDKIEGACRVLADTLSIVESTTVEAVRLPRAIGPVR